VNQAERDGISECNEIVYDGYFLGGYKRNDTLGKQSLEAAIQGIRIPNFSFKAEGHFIQDYGQASVLR
jgi:hypothetical protein